MAKKKPLTVGGRYKRTDFDIGFHERFEGSAEVEDEIYLFINLGGDDYHNEWHEESWRAIHEPAAKDPQFLCRKEDGDINVEPTTRVFVRDHYKKEKDFEYKGVNTIKRHHDPVRNCLIVEKK